MLVGALGDVPLIGFAGAPFTLASYLVEGGPSRNHERTKAMMLGEPETWHALMTALTDVTIGFLRTQVDAGVDAIQLFDSWAGTLSLADYRSTCCRTAAGCSTTLAGDRRADDALRRRHRRAARRHVARPSRWATAVVGVDWRTSLTDAAARVRPGIALQGNLDPVVLLAGWPVVERAVRSRRRRRPARGRRGRDGSRVQPRPRRAAAHRSRHRHRGGRAGALVVSARVLRCRRRYFGSGGRLPAAASRPVRTRRSRVFDPADRLGGVLRTERVGGQPVDVGAEAFIARRPEVPALLAELGLAGRQIGTTGVRPLIYSEGRLHAMPPGHAAGHSRAGVVARGPRRRRDDRAHRRRTVAAARVAHRCADPTVAELVGDRFGEQVVARSVDPLLAGVYAGSSSTIGLRSAATDVGGRTGPRCAQPDRRRARRPPAADADGSVFGAVDGGYAVLLDELVRRADVEWAQRRGAARRTGTARAGTSSTTRVPAGMPTASCSPCPRRGCRGWSRASRPRSAAAAKRIAVASTALVVLALPGGTPLPEKSGVLVAAR